MNNKKRGNIWELLCIHNVCRKYWPESVSSRSESRRLDDAGVDICFTDPFYFQCKTTSKRLNYKKVLEDMPQNENINVILERLTEKRGSRFYKLEDYVHLTLSDFLKLLEMIYDNENDEIPS